MGDNHAWLEQRLTEYPFISGFVKPDRADRDVFCDLKGVVLDAKKYPAINRWKHYLASVMAEELQVLAKQEPDMTVADTETDLPQSLLYFIDQKSQLDTIVLAAELGVPHQKIVGAVKSLLTKEGLIDTKDVVVKELELSKEGSEIVNNGSYEFNVFQAVGADGINQKDLAVPNAKIGMSKAMANGWIKLEKADGGNRLVRKSEDVVDQVRLDLQTIANGMGSTLAADIVKELKKRKLVSEITTKGMIVTAGPNFTITIEKPELDLTAELLASGAWAEKEFKKYNFDAMGAPPASGHYHPLLKVRTEFRQIFLEMGFTEMPTNRYVESSFWNFDALFQPQQHPARDAHDTFFISDPAISTKFPEDYLEKVKSVHSSGGYGSVGYQYDWKIEEAQKNVLRTHTTAVSARQLYQLAQNGFKPAKMFSIDRVFRNETLDATHLAEFHQVEGVVAERNLSLGHVIGLFTEFFRKCGIENLRFKPTYNPYTEPSMEIFAYHDGLKKWVEIGNSGLFRPEMLLPMGLPPDVNVAGFGLSLERPTMIRYGISNIRELFGPKVNMEMIWKNPICRLDKE